ncbi:prepilin-type N-terminal cleavage/methylation domain-containing protein [Undibacterium sp.]|uniref:pilin n=1 Tax=Undibacterium sp. TaxID=1914977 RepID=UPI00351DA805
MKQVQRGFTLIELVMVIVILGVLAAVAMPKFIDLKSDATTAKTAYTTGAKAEHNAARLACLQITGKTDTECGTVDGITE